jgi:parvulin-like peptidyl-prolyl isomerase
MAPKILALLATLLLCCVTSSVAQDGAAPAPTKAHASHILVDTEAEADALNAQLSEASNLFLTFAQLAKEHSKCPSSKKGGDLGTFGRGQMVPEFDRVAFEEEVGVVHKVQTQFGWHLVLISRRLDGTEEPDKFKGLKETLLKVMPFLGPIILIAIMAMGARGGKSGPRAHAFHILVKSEEEADKLFKEIDAAEDKKKKLSELALTHSTCPSGKKGGDLGMFGRGEMVPQFDKIVFEGEVGELAKVQTQFGWHVLLCVERLGDKKKAK